MNKRFKPLWLLLPLILAVTLLSACSLTDILGDSDTNKSDWKPTGASITLLKESMPTGYIVVYQDGNVDAYSAAIEFKELIDENELRTLTSVMSTSVSESISSNEIILGLSDRQVSKEAQAFLE